ncbi:nitrate- and nitrite sensing domain-containing protein [Nocardia sp. NBC_00508]|uniref:sensor histidine kinase n=1 Tax=Nocardia sp. NBC_00508 TaxID=2975992 RepID=UPI002E821477|nr:nitrate- and nitrite sensing domain-containing protein [Nocardia sp. NBC_00508]WUD66460.1 nitrate- and nitrite sensing domain-containing protein [Nocardia sp. NBC_00508]
MFRARLGVRTRILAIALIPSLTLLVVGVGAASYLVAEGTKAKDWAAENQKAIPSTRELMEAVQQERHLTLAQLSGDGTVAPALGAARMRLDAALRGLVAASEGIRDVDDSKLGDNVANFTTLTQHMTAVRSGVDAAALPPADGYLFFNRLLDVISVGTKVAEQTAPDAEIAVRIATGMRLFNATEAMARSDALGAIYGDGAHPPSIPVEEYVRQIGFYHTEIAALSAELEGAEQQHLQTLTAGTAWQQLTAMENAIAQRAMAPVPAAAPTGSSTSGNGTRAAAPPPLPLSTQEWHSAAAEVSRGLIDAWTAHNRASQKLAEDKAAAAATRSAVAGGGVLVVSGLAFLVAVVIANRVIRRLKRLRGETLALADERLPDMMRKLRDGETVDAAAESPDLDYGQDEIGQVAKAFQHAHSAAVAAAVAEARTREGVKAVFLNIAHRSQIVVHRQLEILDEAEQRQEDPILLDTLFRLDHLATRERRNAENLTILGGGKPGRQWRNPVPLIDLVRSAVGETLDYARVRLGRLPDIQVLGSVVADLIHLLAELADNATSFSPPQSRVEVTGNVVGKGAMVEITDQGMGMSEAEVTKTNEMLRNPPDFGLAALSADSRLGLFVVAQLAARHGITVRLSDSDYGGIKAIVIIPSALITGEPDTPQTPAELTDPSRRHSVNGTPAGAGDYAPTGIPSVATPAIEPAAPPRYAPRPFTEARPGPDGRPALPRRNRQTNLAPQLAQPVQEQAASTQPVRSAEQARDLMSAIENGTRQGRRAVISDEQEG